MAMASIPIFIVESFTVNQKLYSGSPVAVCILQYDDDITDEIKQKIAQTTNLSITAFLSNGWTKLSDNIKNEFPAVNSKKCIRWFTPACEVPLCGVGTFAAVKILSYQNPSLKNVQLDSKFSGILQATINNDLITLNFPATQPTQIPLSTDWMPQMASAVLGPDFEFDCVQDAQYSTYLLLRIKKIQGEAPFETMRRVRPDFDQILKVKTSGFKFHGVTVTIEGDEKFNFYSRQFSPQVGLNEDPVCGSAHTQLTFYWASELKLQGQSMRAHQASDQGGDFICQLEGQRVNLGGMGRIVLEGQLYP